MPLEIETWTVLVAILCLLVFTLKEIVMGGKNSKGSGRRYDFGASSSSWDSYGGYPPQSPYPPYQTPQHQRESASLPFYDYAQPKRKLDKRYSRIADNYRSLDEVTAALANAGLESSNLIVGIDFTKSNEWTGKRSFNRRSLHDIGNGQNPYEQAISIIGKTLSAFDEDNLIPCFGFGDGNARYETKCFSNEVVPVSILQT
ncbi:E3 ubiquitin-protein ligase RGLG2 [Spatholobus suberectus]|nr:E3 ubiquitin-protein ligase RGLG2 [Spatholobus suberectus]